MDQSEPLLHFAGRFRKARKFKGFELKEVGAELEVKLPTVGGYEKGRFYPRSYALRDFCTLCEVSADWLLFGGDDPGVVVPVEYDLRVNLRAAFKVSRFCLVEDLVGPTEVGYPVLVKAFATGDASAKTLIAFSEVFGVSCDFLLLGSNEYRKRV